MLIKYRHFVEYEIPYPSDWKEQLLEQVNDEKERELKRTTDDLPRFWTTRTSFIKEDEIDKIELQYKKYIFTVIWELGDRHLGWSMTQYSGIVPKKPCEFLYDYQDLDIIEPEESHMTRDYEVTLYTITKKNGETCEMVSDFDKSWEDHSDEINKSLKKLVDETDGLRRNIGHHLSDINDNLRDIGFTLKKNQDLTDEIIDNLGDIVTSLEKNQD